jgi:hypothetical protein
MFNKKLLLNPWITQTIFILGLLILLIVFSIIERYEEANAGITRFSTICLDGTLYYYSHSIYSDAMSPVVLDGFFVDCSKKEKPE